MTDGAVGAVVSSHGATVAVVAPAGILGHLAPLLAPRSGFEPFGPDDAKWPDDADSVVTATSRAGGGGVVSSEHIAGLSAEDGEELLRLTASTMHLSIAAHATEGVFIHAGAVAWRGVGIVVPGRSMSGKSTLVRELVRSGAELYSDEYAVLDADGQLSPYARPVSLRGEGGRASTVAAEELGAVGSVPVPVGIVVSTRFAPDATWDPTTGRGAAVSLPIVDNSVAARLDPGRTLDAAAAVATRAVCLESLRPDAAATVDHLVTVADGIADEWAARR